MKIHKVLDVAEWETEDGTVMILECFGSSSDGVDLEQFTIHTEFPQFYRIMTHMKKPTLEPYVIADGDTT